VPGSGGSRIIQLHGAQACVEIQAHCCSVVSPGTPGPGDGAGSACAAAAPITPPVAAAAVYAVSAKMRRM